MPPLYRKITPIGLLCLILALTACNLPGAGDSDEAAIAIAQTQIALTQTALAVDPDQGQPPPEADAQDPQSNAAPSLTPSITLTPTLTLTPTQSTPTVTVSRGTNCRTGPGEPFEIIGILAEGEEAEVLGVSADGGTWIIRNPDREGECWLWGQYATVTGPTDGLRVYETPPTPTPAFVWEGAWTTYNFVPGDDPSNYPMTVTVDEDTFSGEVALGEITVNLTGTLSEDNLSVSGTWTSTTSDGTFAFYALGANQFQGSGQRDGLLTAWCGGRSGAGMPDPCLRE